MQSTQSVLPTYALFKPSCYSSSQGWLCYQSTTSQIRLIHFKEDFSIKQTFVVEVDPEPIKTIAIIYDQNTQSPFIIIAFITKYIICKKDQEIFRDVRQLSSNIVDFQQGFAAVAAVSDGQQVYFVLATVNGDLHTVLPHANTNKKMLKSLNEKYKVSSLCVINANAYLGLENGSVSMIDMNLNKNKFNYDSKSEMPIAMIRYHREHLLLGTCQGEIHILSLNLEAPRIISAHYGFIYLMQVTASGKIYSFGEDCLLNFFYLGKDGQLQVESTISFNRRANMIFSIWGEAFINFYEDTTLLQIQKLLK